jgi:hypothetical protein
MGRWRTPAAATAMWAWMEYMQVVAQERKDKALDEARYQLSGMSEMPDKEELNRAVEIEKERRTKQSKRIVQWLLHRQLAQAFGSFYDRVAQLKDKKDMSGRMIQRMLHTHLAAAFDCFSEAIQLRVAHQTTVTKTISRRRTPLVKEMFACWLEYLDDVNQKVKEEAHAQAKQQIADELAKEKCAGEERVAEEKQHRAEQAKRIVQRLLHSQLAYAFDSYLCRALEVRRHRKTCMRVVLRVQHGALAGAFDMFIGTVEQLKAHRQIVEKVMGRWRTPAAATAMWAWMEYMQVVAQERKDKALIVERMLRSQLAYGFDSYLNRVIETKCKRETCKRVVLRMQHRALEGALDMFVGTVEQLKLHRQIVEKAMARWRVPLLMSGFVAWNEYVKELKDSEQRMVKEEAMQQITEEVEEKRMTMQLRDKETQDLKQQLRNATDVYIEELDVLKLAQLSKALAMEERIADEGNKTKTVQEQLQRAQQEMRIEREQTKRSRQDLQNENALLHLQLHELKSQQNSIREGSEFELNEMREELAKELELAKHERNEFAGKLETSKKEAEKNRIMQDELDGIKLALKVQVLLYLVSPLWFMRFALSLPTSPLHSFLLSSLCNLPALTLADQGG